MADPRIQVPPNAELTLGMVCVDKGRPGRTVWEMRADERFANPAGTVQGGFLAAFCDSAMGSATVTYAAAAGRKVFSANMELKISFLAPARVGTRLRCEAEVVSGGSRVVFVEAHVTDEDERSLARSSSTYLLGDRVGGGARPGAGSAPR